MNTSLKFLVVLALVVICLPAYSQPQIVVDPNQIEEELLTGQETDFALSVANDGDALLVWDLEIDYVSAPDNAGEPNWLSLPDFGGEQELGAGDNSDLIIHINAFRLVGGEYLADIHFQSNDPENADIVVGVTLFVIPAPDIGFLFPGDFGNDFDLDFNEIFEDVFVDYDRELRIDIINYGVEALELAEMAVDDEAFSLDRSECVLEPDDSVVVSLTFSAGDTGEYTGHLSFISNDPDEGEAVFRLHVNAVYPPSITTGADHLYIFIREQESNSSEYIDVSNHGRSPLRWSLELTFTGGTNFDTTCTVNVEPTEGVLLPDSSIALTIYAEYRHPFLSKQNFDLTIESNDPDHPQVVIPVQIFRASSIEGEEGYYFPSAFSLSQPFPNPFNSVTRFEYDLPVSGRTRLSVIDIRGREIELLLDGEQTAGTHFGEWDASSVPAGLYFMQLEWNESILRQSVVLLR